MHEIYHEFKDRAAFFVVYIKEAHPSDGWQIPINETESVVYEEPATAERRIEVASACALGLELEIPTLIDGMDNAVDAAYGGHPDRLYLIGADGNIAFKGGPGPFFFKPQRLAEALAAQFE